MGLLWDCFGSTSGSLWSEFDITVRITLGKPWDHFGIILGSRWDNFRITLGSLLDNFGITLGSPWDHFRVTLSRNGSGEALDPRIRYQSTRLGQGTSKFEVLGIFPNLFKESQHFSCLGFSASLGSLLPL